MFEIRKIRSNNSFHFVEKCHFLTEKTPYGFFHFEKNSPKRKTQNENSTDLITQILMC